jgi:ABC-2 type transport system permease protein
MRAALLITTKDLKARIRDRSALLIGIVVPLGLAYIFNLIFSGISGGSSAIDIGVVDQDHGPVAQAFVQDVLGPVSRSGLIAVRAESTESGARSLTANGTLNAVIVIPAGFSDAVQANGPASMKVIGNVDSPISTEIARSIAEAYAAELNRVRLSVAAIAASSSTPLSSDQLSTIAHKAATTTAPLAVRDVSSSNKQLDQKSFYSAGMAVFFLFFTVQFGVMSLLEERNDGTLSRLLAAPISKASILAGKLATSFMLGTISMAVLAIATTLMFGASWGNPMGVAILIVAAVLSATGITALIASIARSAEQASNWQTIVAVLLGLVGGTFFPVSQAPGILSTITFIAPQAWFLRGLGDLRGGDLSAIWLPVLAMLLFALVTGGIAMTRMRHLGEV